MTGGIKTKFESCYLRGVKVHSAFFQVFFRTRGKDTFWENRRTVNQNREFRFQILRSDPPTVNFIGVFPSIQKEPGNERDIIGKLLLASSDQSRCKGETVNLNERFKSVNLSVLVQSAFATSVEMKLFWLIKWCPIRVNSVATDKGHIGLHYDRRDQNVNESSRVAILEVLRSIRRFFKFSSEPVAKFCCSDLLETENEETGKLCKFTCKWNMSRLMSTAVYNDKVEELCLSRGLR
ncbi:uncharacterized protein LOC108825650 [Raphanus sativus]|uniref:Uncharacterized protein LOC108825650 n=1 Tax=Raphanus sativus TaxID=3726 RepID=A0A9W3C375_RAPSA|nr:uncharacterized protein LOC108825650 [Raphanus sativus]